MARKQTLTEQLDAMTPSERNAHFETWRDGTLARAVQSARQITAKAATYQEAMAAGRAAGDASMKKAGRTEWNHDDYIVAAEVRNSLDPLY